MSTGKNGVFAVSGNNGFSGQLIWSEEYDISTNSSTLALTLQIKSTKNYGPQYYPNGTIKVDGTAAITMNSLLGTHNMDFPQLNTWRDIKVHGGALAFPITYGPIYHNQDGKKTVTIAVDVSLATIDGTAGHGSKVSGSQSIALTNIPRFATITAAPNFNDEENPTITYSNPAGTSATSLRACITLDGTVADIEYRDVSKTGNSYTFNLTNAERDVLRAATTGGNSRSVGFYLRTEIGGSVDASRVWRTLTIKNPNPTIDPTVTDANSATVALTGDRSKLVRYYSDAHVIIDAQAVKKATLTSQKVACGNKSLNGDGTIEAVESGTFVFTATDSRGNTTKKTVTHDLVEYVKLSCLVGNAKPNTEGQMTFKVNGSYFNGSFGAVDNTLAVYYRYKVSGGTYGNWTAMNVSLGDESYIATANLTGLDYQTAYVFQAYAVDKLATVYSSEKVVKAAPVFDWGESDFKFNVPVFDQFGTNVGNGLAAYSGGGASGIDPNTTLESLCLTSHSNAPQGLGTFYYIHTVFYNTKSATAARSQMAMPYNKSGSMYHRYYSGGAWSSWARYMTADETYPVGSVVIRYDSTSPATLYGGTWQRIEGRMLYGCASSGTIGATGTHTTGSGSSSLPYINVAIWRRTA